MNPITPQQPSQTFGFASLPIATPSRTTAATSRQTGVDSAYEGRPGCSDVRAMAQRLDRAIGIASASGPDAFVVLRITDLRQMDGWGIRIHGETLRSYFDLGSIDDVEQRYPVTLYEAQLLRGAVSALNEDSCPPPTRSTPWRRTV